MVQRWNRYWFTPEQPFSLGVCRALAYAVAIYACSQTSFAQWAELGSKSAFWSPLWLFTTLHLPLFGAKMLGIMQVILMVSLVLGCIGLFTKYATAVSFVLGTYLLALTFNYGKVEDQTNPMVIVMGILALSRCGDGFSADAWLRARRGLPAPQPSGEYRWPIRAVWLMMSIAFCAAAIAKLRNTGIQWALSPAFSTLLIEQFYGVNPPKLRIGLFIANHAWLAYLMASGSLLTELFFPLAMFDRRARRLFPLATFGMQLGIGLVMNIWFIQFLALYVFWIPWGKVLGVERESPEAASVTSAGRESAAAAV